MNSRASVRSGETTTGTPGLRMPAFSPAISRIEWPRKFSWSKSMGVMRVTAGGVGMLGGGGAPPPASKKGGGGPAGAQDPEGKGGGEMEKHGGGAGVLGAGGGPMRWWRRG